MSARVLFAITSHVTSGESIAVRSAEAADAAYVVAAMQASLSPYYGGNHRAHARRLIHTHLAGGVDERGSLSSRQLLLILWQGDQRRGVLNLAFKRQGTCKISPLIIHPVREETLGLGSVLLGAAIQLARRHGSRQLFCTVAKNNRQSLQFFLQNGFLICGYAPGQYKSGETEVLLRRSLQLLRRAEERQSPISVGEMPAERWPVVKEMLINVLGEQLDGVPEEWLESLRTGSLGMAGLEDDEQRPVWVFTAEDRTGRQRAAAVVTPKKGDALKVMPVAAADLEGFEALIIDLPGLLAGRGRKAYLHTVPSEGEVEVLQENGWELEAQLPGAYRAHVVTQQWGLPLSGDDLMRTLRIRDNYLKLIAGGKKDLEVRVGYDHLRKITPGDRLRFVAPSGRMSCRVKDVRNYASFREMLDHEDVGRALPGMDNREALRRLTEIYPPHKERLGVIVLEIDGISEIS